MDPSCLPARVVGDLALLGLLALPGTLAARLGEWERLCGEERERAAADVALMAGLAAR